MVPYYGDFAVNSTVRIPINTFSSNDPTASVTVTDLLNTDVHIHKDGGTTQRNNAAGITMTIDYDSITGNHLLAIDTSDNTVADFFQAGHEYHVRIEGATVDAGTINAWVGAFSIERAGGALALIKSATYGLSALKSLLDTTGIKVLSIANNAITAAAINDAAIDNATFAADVGSTAYATNIIALSVRKALDEIKLDHLAAVADSDDVADNSIIGKLASTDGDWSKYSLTTDSLQSIRDKLPVNLEDMSVTDTTGYVACASTQKVDIETIKTQSVTCGASVTVLASVGTAAASTAQTGDSYAIVNGDHGLVSIQDDIDLILADTGELQTNQGNWLTATGFSTHGASDVWSVEARTLTANTNLGGVEVDLTKIHGTAITETDGQLAGAFTKFFDVAAPTATCLSLPTAVPGANGGLTTTNGTKVNQTVDLTAGQSIACSDKTGFALSDAGVDAVFDRNSSLSISFENLINRTYQIVNNKMNITDATGVVALRNIADNATIATGSVTDDLTTTVRDGLTWA